MANDIKLQESHPVDENLRPLKVGGKSTAIETAQHGNGARVNGDLEVTGDITGNIKDIVMPDVTIDPLNTNNIVSTDLTIDDSGDITLDAAGGDINLTAADVNIDTTQKLYFDGGSDTYINEASADLLQIVVGTSKLLLFDENGDDGNSVYFKSSCAGFTKIAESFSDDSIIGSGGTDDTHIDFRHTNKISLAVTGNITNLNLIFPPMSGNFLLLLTYDGDHTITNYKVYENDESAADGDADVFWAGGTKPDNTASGVDILSFFYDASASADKCYGVASLAFATP